MTVITISSLTRTSVRVLTQGETVTATTHHYDKLHTETLRPTSLIVTGEIYTDLSASHCLPTTHTHIIPHSVQDTAVSQLSIQTSYYRTNAAEDNVINNTVQLVTLTVCRVNSYWRMTSSVHMGNCGSSDRKYTLLSDNTVFSFHSRDYCRHLMMFIL